jgi:hypothetical protein
MAKTTYTDLDIYLAFDGGYDYGYMMARRDMRDTVLVITGVIAAAIAAAVADHAIRDNVDKIAAGVAKVGRGIKRAARAVMGFFRR